MSHILKSGYHCTIAVRYVPLSYIKLMVVRHITQGYAEANILA